MTKGKRKKERDGREEGHVGGGGREGKKNNLFFKYNEMWFL